MEKALCGKLFNCMYDWIIGREYIATVDHKASAQLYCADLFSLFISGSRGRVNHIYVFQVIYSYNLAIITFDHLITTNRNERIDPYNALVFVSIRTYVLHY